MQYELNKQDRYTVIKVKEANLNSVMAPELKAKFVELGKEHVENLILDLSEVQFVDSSGLSAILTADRLWKGLNGSFVLTGVKSPSVKKLIEISRLDSILKIVPSVAESIDFVMMESLQRELNANIDEEEQG
jgi:anti-sigma B factor antagonist